MQNKLIATILLLASTTAYADVHSTAMWLRSVKSGRMLSNPHSTLDDCMPSIERARKAGKTLLSDSAFIPYGANQNHEITLDKAENICRDAVYYRDVVRKDIAVFEWFNPMAFAMMHGTNDMSYYKTVEEHVDACDKAVEALLAAGVPASTPFEVGFGKYQTKTIADIKPKLCDAARAESKSIEKARTDKEAEEQAPYLKAGIKGDKLDFLLKNDGSVWLPGKRAPAGDGIKQYAKASTMFVWTTSDPDGWNYVVHDVYKYVFKGNNLVKTSNKSYRMQYGKNLGAAAFK